MVTLDRLVNVLGSYGVRLRFCPIPRSTELRSVVMHEVTDGSHRRRRRAAGYRCALGEGGGALGGSARAVVVLIRGGDDDTASAAWTKASR